MAGPAPRLRSAALPRLAGLAALFAVLALVGPAPPAGAHAQLVSSSPADGEILPEAPPEVVLRFSERVRATLDAIRVLDSTGGRVDAGNSAVRDGDTVAVGLDGDLADGTYVVSWRVVSADAHPIHGGYLFSVGRETTVEQAVVDGLFEQQGDRGWQVAGAVLRALAYAGTFLAAGAALVLVALGVGDERRRLTLAMTLGAVVGIAGVLLGLPVQAALATGLGADALFGDGVLGQVVGDGVGASIVAAVLGLATVVVGVRRRPTGAGDRVLLVAGALAATSFALAGHTRANTPAWLTTFADAVHALAGAAWFGGLLVVVVVARSRRAAGDDRAAADLVARFSALAVGLVGAVAGAGLLLSYSEVRTLDALVSTTYGRLLLLKVVLVGVVLGLAAWNRSRLVPAVAADPDPSRAWKSLVRSIRAEVVVIAAVLAVTAVLVNVTPARTAAGVGGPTSVTVPLGDGTVNLTVDPGRAGRNTVHVYLLDELGRQADVARELTLAFSLPAKDLGPLEQEPFKAGPGHYQYDGNAMSIPGAWQIEVIARTSRFDEYRATAEVAIR